MNFGNAMDLPVIVNLYLKRQKAASFCVRRLSRSRSVCEKL